MFERKKMSPSGMIENGLKKGVDIRVEKGVAPVVTICGGQCGYSRGA
jgi:hypothetical protein